MKTELLKWFRQLKSISQYGLTYTKDPYDRERFEAVARVASEIATRLTGATELEVEAALKLEAGPPTPKLDVRAAVFRGDAILLVRETADGLWSLPGGWAEVDESPARSAERETKEESGYDCRATKLIAVWDRNLHAHPPMLLHVYKLFYLCELLGGEPKPSQETTEIGFFTPENLPPLSTARVLRAQIECAFRHRAEPGLPTEFD
ncbi:MAG: NUDIX hydrolase [Myxococcales bacterium]|jgi:ADP-ribose pyrophosphatase YjhB (NUDIX family)